MDVAALSVFGLTEEDIDNEYNNVYVFPDVWDSFMVFEFLGTQWRTSSGGVIGLDYNVIPLAFKTLGIKKSKQDGVMFDIRIMESTAINILNAENNKKRG